MLEFWGAGRRHCLRVVSGLVASLSVLSGAFADDDAFDPDALDLARLIECDAQVPDYNALASWLATEPDAAQKLGWRSIESGNPFLAQYEMERPVQVFGAQTTTIVFAGSALLAVLDDRPAPQLAARLNIRPMIDSAEKFLGERVISEETDDSVEMMTIHTRVSLNVSTVESHPGKTLVGCSYSFRMDVKE